MPSQDAPEFKFGPWNAGLVNAVDIYSLPPDALSVAEDVDIDRDGVVTTRKKWALLDANPYTSVFEHNGVTYAAEGEGFPRVVGVVGEGSFTAISHDGVGKLEIAGPVSWTVLNEEPVFTDGVNICIVRGLVAYTPDAGYFKGDENDEFQLMPMPGGSSIHYWQGRLVVSRGNSLIWSEAMRYGVYSATRNFVRFPSKITWVAPLPTGIYVGVRDNVYFLSGSDPAKFTRVAVGGKSAPGVSAVYNVRHAQTAGEDVALWFTSDGIAVGQQSGAVEYPQAGRLKEIPLHPGKMVVENDRVTIFTTKEH